MLRVLISKSNYLFSIMIVVIIIFRRASIKIRRALIIVRH